MREPYRRSISGASPPSTGLDNFAGSIGKGLGRLFCAVVRCGAASERTLASALQLAREGELAHASACQRDALAKVFAEALVSAAFPPGAPDISPGEVRRAGSAIGAVCNRLRIRARIERTRLRDEAARELRRRALTRAAHQRS